MELNTFEGGLAIVGPQPAQAHDDPALRPVVGGLIHPGGDTPAVLARRRSRDRIGRDDERVVACSGEGAGHAGEQPEAVVLDLRRLAVDGFDVSDDAHAEAVADALVPQADAQDGHDAGEGLDDVRGDAGLVGRARAGRDDHVRRPAATVQGAGLGGRDPVVADDDQVAVKLKRPVQLAQPLDQVPGEAVVVVDDEDHEQAYAGLNQECSGSQRGTTGSAPLHEARPGGSAPGHNQRERGRRTTAPSRSRLVRDRIPTTRHDREGVLGGVTIATWGVELPLPAGPQRRPAHIPARQLI